MRHNQTSLNDKCFWGVSWTGKIDSLQSILPTHTFIPSVLLQLQDETGNQIRVRLTSEEAFLIASELMKYASRLK